MMLDIESRNMEGKANAAGREILLSFWKVHILHHASEAPVHGQWVLTELRRHGYEISPGTLYPLLHRMERYGWLKCRKLPGAGQRARADYRLTAEGRKVLALVRAQLEELHREVVVEAGEMTHGPDRRHGAGSGHLNRGSRGRIGAAASRRTRR